MTEEQSKEVFKDLLDIMAITAMNQNKENFDFKELVSSKGYTL